MDFHNLEPESADTPFGERTTAGKIFGATGGVMEAAIRSAYFLITGKELGELKVEAVRGMKGVREAKLNIDGMEIGVAVAHTLKNAAALLDQIKNGRKDIHFIEIMTCPGGCVGGGGQPIGTNVQRVLARTRALYELDEKEQLKTSHSNPWIKRIYEEFLGEPLSKKSHELLHTHYHKREI
jgi:iron only hydrogenase large subunit-like protein